MSVELETVGAASIGGLSTKQDADLAGQPCRNCGEVVEQRYCTNCGQLAASFHRPIWSLIGETVTDTLALDGRLARTLPVLLFRPGRLTKNYTEGKRARYVPPFRLFLLASLLFYLVLFALVPTGTWVSMDDETRANIEQNLTDAPGADEVAQTAQEQLEEAGIYVDAPDEIRGDIENQVLAVINNPDQFAAELEKWLPRLSILLVPLTILALGFLHVWRRKLYIYDHSIHALHLHSWIYITGSFMMLAGPYLPGFLLWLYIVSFLVYVARSLKVVGSTGWFMASLRVFLLFVFWVAVTAIIAVATVIISGMSVKG